MVSDQSIRVLAGTRNWRGAGDGNVRFGHFLLLLLLVHFGDASKNISTDTSALLAFKKFADPAGNVLLSWSSDAQPSPCTTWEGVTCNKDLTRVVAISVSGSELSGTFSAGTLSDLSMLKTLDVSYNNFQGSMPDDLGNLKRLEQLWAMNARFSGSFPNSLANSNTLTTMSLSGNNFSGLIPDLNGSTAMVSLDLSSNGFSGRIPALPPFVVNVSLSNNRLNDSILSSLAVPSSLKNLDLSNNQLSGPIPLKLLNVPNVTLDGNPQLCGRPTPNQCASDVPGKHKSTKAIIVIVVVNVVGFALILSGLLVYFSKSASFKKALTPKDPGVTLTLFKKAPTPKDPAPGEVPVKPPPPPDPPGTGGISPENETPELIFVDEFAPKFELEELLRASAEVLGKGSLGTTYKARLNNGHMVAVKRLKDVKEMPKKDFEKQMNALGQMNHPNLLPLRAYYYNKEEKLLVYDYMYYGSIDSILHGPKDAGSGKTTFPWDSRLRVAYEVALGLNFLHENFPARIIPHQNLKSSNVILGNNHELYLADFCLVPLMPSRIAAQGMTGYAAPEYNRSKKRSEKADIYSYGVLLLELLTGRKPAHATDPDGMDLPKFVKGALNEEWTVEVFDSQLKTSSDGDAEMATILQIAMKCVNEDPHRRPSLPQVLDVLASMKLTKEAYLDSSQSGDLRSYHYDSREREPDHDSASFSR